jgi:hypothetical protein
LTHGDTWAKAISFSIGGPDSLWLNETSAFPGKHSADWRSWAQRNFSVPWNWAAHVSAQFRAEFTLDSGSILQRWPMYSSSTRLFVCNDKNIKVTLGSLIPNTLPPFCPPELRQLVRAEEKTPANQIRCDWPAHR